MSYLFILSTASCVLELLVPIITKFLTDLISFENNTVRLKRNDLISIKQKMGEISMIDEFAKYAKLQRQYIKLETELSGQANDLMLSKMKLSFSLNCGLRVLNGITVAVMLYLYRWEPVAILPKDSLWPLQNILSWPCPLENSISLTMWLVISRLAISCCK